MEKNVTRQTKAILVRLILAGAIGLSGCIALVHIDLTGIWEGELLWSSGPSAGFTSPISINIVHENRDISGTVTLVGPGSEPFVLTISSGRTNARSIRIDAFGTLAIGSSSISVTLSLEGDFDAETMSGTGTQTIDGKTYEFTWEMARISGPPES